jgi:23S rRNA pseudouridine1911/1915/1917 synthase
MVDVIYLDNHLLVADKPVGLVTQPTDVSDDSFQEQCQRWLKVHANKPGNVFLHPAHRIDKPVSGIVVFAKTSKALSRLNDAFRQHKVRKSYIAWVEGQLEASEGTLEHYLAHDSHFARVTSTADPEGKLCRLHFRVIARHPTYSVVEVELETGRYHQIRAQFAAIGAPIVGDKRYGSSRFFVPEGIALQHAKIQLPHPTSQQLLSFAVKAPLGALPLSP